MEPQVEIYCKKECKKKDCSCLWLVLSVVFFVLSFFVGALVAEITGFVATLTVGAVIVLIIALALLAIIAIINLVCCKNNNKKKYYC